MLILLSAERSDKRSRAINTRIQAFMKKSIASLLSGAICLLLSSGSLTAENMTTNSSAGDTASMAKSLQQSAQTHLDAIKADKGDQGATSARGLALQAQKAAADTAVSAHQSAQEWTEHAKAMAQAADKMNSCSTANCTKSEPAASTVDQTTSPVTATVKDKVSAVKDSVSDTPRRRWSK